MKDAAHHLKHVQKKVIQSVRRSANSAEAEIPALISEKKHKKSLSLMKLSMKPFLTV